MGRGVGGDEWEGVPQDSLIPYLYLMLFRTYSVIPTWLAIHMFLMYISVCEGSELLECVVTVMGYVGVHM